LVSGDRRFNGVITLKSKKSSKLSLAERLNLKIHGGNPFQEFDVGDLIFDPQGWFGNTKVVDDVIAAIRPDCILEVGTWKGASALYMGKKLREINEDCAVVCVDTWLGSVEHWVSIDRDELMFKNGHPQLYRQFMTNIVHEKLEDVIVPMPMPSRQAATILDLINFQAPAVYIDGGHDLRSVSEDLENFWPLVIQNGILFGDDYSMAFKGVVEAVDSFVLQNRQQIQRSYIEGHKYVIQKK
jgi:hypothetical protein